MKNTNCNTCKFNILNNGDGCFGCKSFNKYEPLYDFNKCDYDTHDIIETYLDNCQELFDKFAPEYHIYGRN